LISPENGFCHIPCDWHGIGRDGSNSEIISLFGKIKVNFRNYKSYYSAAECHGALAMLLGVFMVKIV